jgi:DNA-directed RNA polymerase specialized sigma24 family protein
LSADLELVRDSLHTFLLARFQRLGADDLLDVADEALFRLVEESRQQGRALDYPAAWLFRVASREAISRLRRPADSTGREEQVLNDDALAALIEANASRATVEHAFRRAVADSDHVAVQVVQAWLDLASELGVAPSSRAVANRIAYSHTTVNSALDRFRSYLAEENDA